MSLIVTVKVPDPISKPVKMILNMHDKRKFLKGNEILKSREAELFAKQVRRNKRIEAIAAFVIGSLMYAEKAIAVAPNANLGKIDTAGNTILGICRSIGYWACIIMCVIEVIKALLQGDTKGISKIVAKYALGFGSLYLTPWIFDLIKDIFA